MPLQFKVYLYAFLSFSSVAVLMFSLVLNDAFFGIASNIVMVISTIKLVNLGE